MSKNNNLLKLLRSLSLKDKRNFKLFLKKYDVKDSKYGILYHLIIKHLDKSEEDIKELYIKKIKDENYSNTKTYLEKKIIESLGIANRENSDIIKECNILIQRGLINLADEHAKTLKPKNNGLDKINCLTIEKKILNLKHNLGQYSTSELIQIERRVQIETKLQIELRELSANANIKLLYTQHGKNITQKEENATYIIEFALQSIKEIEKIDGTNLSDEFNFKKYMILINIAQQIRDIDLLQKFSVPLIHYWENNYSINLSLLEIYASMMTAYTYSNNKNTLENIELLEAFIKSHPTVSSLEKKIINELKILRLIELCLYKNIKFEEVSSQYVFKDLIKEAIKLEFKKHKFQWLIYKYLLYCLKYNLFEIALQAYKNIEFDNSLKKEANLLIPIKNIEILIFINLEEYQLAKSLILSNTKYIQRNKTYSTDIKTYYKLVTNIINALQNGQKQQVINLEKELQKLCKTNYFANNISFRTDFIKHWIFNNPIFTE